MRFCRACGFQIISLMSHYFSKYGLLLKCENPNCVLNHDAFNVQSRTIKKEIIT